MNNALGLAGSSAPSKFVFDKTGLVLWLTGDRYTSVAGWEDQGTDLRTDVSLLTGDLPTQNVAGNNTALVFGGNTGLYCPLGVNLGENHSIFVVFSYPGGQPSSRAVLMEQTLNGYTLYLQGGAIKTGYTGNGLVSAPLATNTKWLVSDIYNSTSGTGTSLFVNGMLSVSSATAGTMGIGSDLFIGADDNALPQYFLGSIFEILVYNRALGTTKRSVVDAYLKNKHGIV